MKPLQTLRNYFIPPAVALPKEDNRAVTLIRFQTQRVESMDMLTWKNAIEAATNATIQRWYYLQDMYDQCELDGHLYGVLEKRRLNITLSDLQYCDVNGDPIPEVMDLFKGSRWFDFLTELINARFRGYSPLQFKAGNVFDFEPIPRRHVMPGAVPMLLSNYTDSKGMSFEDPRFIGTMCNIDTRSMGLLSVVSQYVIMKRNTLADNAQYLEQYAMPINAITYNGNDPNTKEQVKSLFENRGSNLTMTLPEGMDAKLLQGSNSSSTDAYKGFLDRMDAQISKAVLGQTMTTDDGSSQAQANVHKEVNDAIDKADKVWATAWLNERFGRYMALWGVTRPGKWEFNEDAGESLDVQIANDLKLKELLPEADPDYWYKKYDIPRRNTPVSSANVD